MDEQTETPEPDESMEPPMEAAEETKPSPEAQIQGFAPESVNLAVGMGEDEQRKIVDDTIANFDRDWDSLTQWRARRENILKLFLGMIPAPEDGEMRSAIHYPIIAKAIIRLHARIYDQQFPSNGEYFGVKAMDATDLERAVRVSKHLNWQTMTQIPEYVPNHDVLIQQWLLYGSAFSYMYWNAETNRPCHEACRTEDIVISYNEHSDDPSMGDVARITRILRKYRHEIESLADKGYYTNAEKLYEANQDPNAPTSEVVDMKDNSIRETMDRFEGKDRQQTGANMHRKLIEMHCWRKLEGEERERPVIITVDVERRALLCLKAREDEDPQDRARYNREKAAAKAQYDLAIAEYERDMAVYLQNASQAEAQTMTAPPMPGEQTTTGLPIPGPTTATMDVGQPPQPPSPPPDPAQPKMVPINFFTHYICIPNPEGFYGLGIGALLEGHNMMADTMASQILDAGTLSNTSTFIFSRQAKLSRGEFKIRPGMGNETDLSPQDLDKGIKMLQFGRPEPALGQLIKDQEGAGDDISGAGDILSGEVGGSNETATTTQIRISQALAAISIQNKRYTRARSEEAKKLARLNSVHLSDSEYFPVVDPYKNAPPANQEIGRMDYLQDVDIIVTADPRMASQPQRVAEAMQAIEATMQNPLLAQNAMLVTALYRNLYIAMDRPDLVAALSAPPPVAPPMGPPPGSPQPKQEGGPPPNGGGRPHPSPMAPPVPNAGPTPQNGGEPMGQGA